MSWSQTIIIGNVGRDPVFEYTAQGVARCNFSVAVNKVTGKGDNRQTKTLWFNVTIWRERAETANQYIKKGMKIMIVGEIDARIYTDKQGQPQLSLDLTARDFQFLDSRGEGQGGEYQPARQGQGGEEPEDTGDIPF